MVDEIDPGDKEGGPRKLGNLAVKNLHFVSMVLEGAGVQCQVSREILQVCLSVCALGPLQHYSPCQGSDASLPPPAPPVLPKGKKETDSSGAICTQGGGSPTSVAFHEQIVSWPKSYVATTQRQPPGAPRDGLRGGTAPGDRVTRLRGSGAAGARPSEGLRT